MRRTLRPLAAFAVVAVVGAGCGRTESSGGTSTTARAGKGVALAANQSEGAIPQSGDLCGGTGGNGQIVSVGNDTFTIKRNDDDSNQIIHLTSRAIIETSAGSTSLSDLKITDRVTLVGNPNPDGSFTANTVVVCTRTDQKPQSGRRRTTDSKRAEAWNTRINVLAVLLVGSVWVGIVAYFRLKRKTSLVFLLFFSVFYAYLIKVLDYTLFQFQSLIVLKTLCPRAHPTGTGAAKSSIRFRSLRSLLKI